MLVGIFSIGLYLTTESALSQFQKLDKDWQHFIPLLGLAVLALLLFAIRNKPNVNKHQLLSLELLILIISPTVDSFTILAKYHLFILAAPIFVLTVAGWFFFIFTREGKSDVEKNEITKANKIYALWFSGLLIMGITLLWMVLQILPPI